VRRGTGEVRVLSLDARPKEKVTTDAVVSRCVVVRTAHDHVHEQKMFKMLMTGITIGNMTIGKSRNTGSV
jgi:hypothetical protein